MDDQPLEQLAQWLPRQRELYQDLPEESGRISRLGGD